MTALQQDGAEAAARHGPDVQVTTRERDAKGFTPLPLRWRTEATFRTTCPGRGPKCSGR